MLREGLLSDLDLADTIIKLAHSDFINRDDVRRDLVALASHPACDVRSEAMGALAYHGVTFAWNVEPGRQLLATLLRAVGSDADGECRRTAAGSLGSLFRMTHRRDVLEALAAACRKPEEEPDVRAFAFCAILDVVGKPKKDQPSPTNLRIGPQHLREVSAYLDESAGRDEGA